MMLVRNYAELYLVVHLLCLVLFGRVKSNQTNILNVTSSLSFNESIQGSPYNLQSTVSTSSYRTNITTSSKVNGTPIATSSKVKSTPVATSSKAQTTATITPVNDDKKMEGHIIIIIVTVAAIAVFTIAIVLLICIFRRRRVQRLERDRNLSYNNMNYESTVKFRVDKNGEFGNMEGASDDVFSNSNKTTVPAKKGNNNRPNEGYEIVDLPNSSGAKGQKREYENVAPQNLNGGDDKEPSSSKPYENVTPLAVASEDNKKVKPENSQLYEHVLLSSPSKSVKDEQKDKRYENIDLPNLSQ